MRIITFVYILFLLPIIAIGQDYPQEVISAAHTISSNTLTDHVKEMCLPKYHGRGAGSPGYDSIATWVIKNLTDWGVKPAGANGNFYQEFPRPYTKVFSQGEVELILVENGDTLKKSYTIPDQFFPASNSDSGEVTAEVVFVGYGISAPEFGYDDYEGIDVKGKIVIFRSESPVDSNSPDVEKWVPYSLHQYKFQNALKHEVAGVLYIGTTANPSIPFQKGMIYAHIGTEALNDLFFGTELVYDSLLSQIKKTMKPASVPLKKSVRISTSTKHFPNTKTANIIGVIEGSDPKLKEEVIIIGAHLDGQGNPGVLLPGALDNATGVANVLEVARALASLPEKPKRSVAFIFIGAEECGLIGSNYFVENPTFPKGKTVCFINLDMVGNGTGLALWGGESYPEILQAFKDANSDFIHRDFSTSQARMPRTRPRSDGAVFLKAGYKSVGVGTINWVKPVNYHHPNDRPETTICPEIMEDASRMLFLGVWKLANQ
ncbi:MAG TPA: M20/M25/M40 family metallo-hydrolase [Tenuifilaceae bacterium]|nr:M20/M25/M40 family metallo-hydrolase [Tenuifilaceae bacterium]